MFRLTSRYSGFVGSSSTILQSWPGVGVDHVDGNACSLCPDTAVPEDARLPDEEDDDTVWVDAPDKSQAAAPDVKKNFDSEWKVKLEAVPLT